MLDLLGTVAILSVSVSVNAPFDLHVRQRCQIKLLPVNYSESLN